MLGALCKAKCQARIIVKISLPGSAMASKGIKIRAHIYATLGKLFSVLSSLNWRYNTHLFKVKQ